MVGHSIINFTVCELLVGQYLTLFSKIQNYWWGKCPCCPPSLAPLQKKDKYLNDFHFKLIFLLFIFMRSISFEHQTGLLSVIGSSSLGLLGSATSFDEFLEDSLIIGGSSTVGT